MTQEEKAKAYDEALKRAKAILKVTDNMRESLLYVSTIFPELKDDGEKIRKEIISALKYANHKGVYDKHITWLEKQGEQKVSAVEFNAKDWYVSKVDGKIYNAKFMEKPHTNQTRKLEIEKAAMSATGIIEQEEWFIKGAEWADENPSYISSEKQGEQKVSYTTTVETGDGGINALVTKDIEIPFGAKDSELQEVAYFIPKGYYAKIEGDKVVIKKGEENPATIDVDKMVGDYAKSNVRDNEEFGKPLPCMIRAYRQGLNDAINGKNDGSERL